MEKVSWAYKDFFIIKKIFSSDALRLFFIEGVEHNWDLIPMFEPRDKIYVVISHNASKWNFEFSSKVIQHLNPRLDINQFVWLCNTFEQLKWAREVGFDAILFNHNSFLDENVYKILDNISNRIYDLVINVRPENWKRPYLAQRINNLAVIKGLNHRKDDFYDLNQLNPVYINDSYLSTQQVVSIYNKSFAGACFSAEEGACYTSSEFLLSGLPVISTESQGGRDYWYNSSNSIIVPNDPAAVLAAVDEVKFNFSKNIWNRDAIRAGHIEESHRQRISLIDNINKHLSIRMLPQIGFELFNNNFSNKFTKVIKSADVLRLFE